MSFLKYSILTFLSFVVSLTLAAQANVQAIELSGKVTSKGKGIPNAAVTDGINIVKTNKKGGYVLQTTDTTSFVHISIPAGYKVPIKNNTSIFFYALTDKKTPKQVYNFELEKLANNEDKHTIIAWADPQVYFEDELIELKEGADDVKELIEEYYSDVPTYGLVAGDIIGYSKDADLLYPPIKKLISDTGVPFFYVPGNHDVDMNSTSNARSKRIYNDAFGPSYYSFNRGKVHYVMLDNIFYNADNGGYKGFIEEKQMNWLEKDLKMIAKGSTVILTMHIPTYSPEARRGEYHKELAHRVLQNRESLYALLEPFNVHIFSGHEHYVENYEIKENLFEHVHTTLSGLFWMAPWSWDGSPRGYTVYEIDGEDIKWYSKSVGKDRDHQFNAYPIGANNQKPDAITANIWNYDPAWKVYWYENGIKQGEMEQFTGYDSSIVDFVKKNKQNFKHKGIGASLTEHLFFAVPKSKESKIEVEVIDRFGKSYLQRVVTDWEI